MSDREEAWDVLKGQTPADEAATTKARLTVALWMLEQYRIDIRRHCDPWFCRGQWYRECEQLLGLET